MLYTINPYNCREQYLQTILETTISLILLHSSISKLLQTSSDHSILWSIDLDPKCIHIFEYNPTIRGHTQHIDNTLHGREGELCYGEWDVPDAAAAVRGRESAVSWWRSTAGRWDIERTDTLILKRCRWSAVCCCCWWHSERTDALILKSVVKRDNL